MGLGRFCLNTLEREAIILNSAYEMINEMVNWAIFTKHDRTDQVVMMFNTRQDRRLFIILLGDFLSIVRAYKGEPAPLGLLTPPAGARLSDLTFLFHLRQVCASPQMGEDVGELSAAVESFAAWLETEFVSRNVNLSSISVVADLCVSRYRYLKMCGDIAKHSLARLAGNVKHFRALLDASGQPVSEHDGYLALANFFDWFFEDIFIRHAQVIAEFLNNIRWAIFEYLRPEYMRSWHRPEGTPDYFYRFRIPENCTEPVAQAMYWDLMNHVRARPWIQRFTIDAAMKIEY